MFRYIAFCWDPTRPDHATAAGRLQQRLNAHSAWSPALDCTGLQVYTAGARAGINQVYSLPLNQGVVLGRIFRRHNQASRR
jgi:asparagine synthase (glutamine-hydrolysing)